MGPLLSSAHPPKSTIPENGALRVAGESMLIRIGLETDQFPTWKRAAVTATVPSDPTAVAPKVWVPSVSCVVSNRNVQPPLGHEVKKFGVQALVDPDGTPSTETETMTSKPLAFEAIPENGAKP
jgi:hypothetical protein